MIKESQTVLQAQQVTNFVDITNPNSLSVWLNSKFGTFASFHIKNLCSGRKQKKHKKNIEKHRKTSKKTRNTKTIPIKFEVSDPTHVLRTKT